MLRTVYSIYAILYTYYIKILFLLKLLITSLIPFLMDRIFSLFFFKSHISCKLSYLTLGCLRYFWQAFVLRMTYKSNVLDHFSSFALLSPKTTTYSMSTLIFRANLQSLPSQHKLMPLF